MFPSSRVAATVHLLPALAAVLVTVVGLVEWGVRARARLKRYGPALASLNLPEAARGTVLQRQIFERPDCLTVYGSSELAIAQPTRADLFFHRKRQGFDVVVVGQAGDRCLALLQELASLGEAARGKKVVVFLSPVWFLPGPELLQHDHAAHHQFAAAFSPLQTGRFVVDSPLHLPLKRQIAARLLDYSAVIQARSPLLDSALDSLRQPVWTRRCLLAAITPLVEMQNQVLLFQEQCYWSELASRHPALRPAVSAYKSRGKRMEWVRLEREVARMEAKRGPGTFYSEGAAPENSQKSVLAGLPPEDSDQDPDFLRRMRTAPEWNDLELLLKASRQLGIHLLLIDQPINGLLSNRQGITPQARQKYYERVGRVAAAYRVPLRDFSAYEEDRTFFMDPVHPSAEAWVHYDQALDEFFGHKRS